MIVDLDKQTTIRVYKDCDDWVKQNVPAEGAAERHRRLCKFWEDNYNITNIEWMAKEIRAEVKRALKEDKENGG